MATDTILRFEDVVAGYGKQTILHGLSFDVRRGAITTVIGPNGAGKSTAFKALFGMLPVRSGRIVLEGDEITNLTPRQPDLRRRLAALLTRPDYQVAEVNCGDGYSAYVLIDAGAVMVIHRDREVGGLEQLTRL